MAAHAFRQRSSNTRRTLTRIALLLLAATAIAGCSDSQPAEVQQVTYEGFRSGDGFPADQAAVLDAVERGDERAIRAHAWSLWARLTAPSSQAFDGKVLPTWETWYAGAELYEGNTVACLPTAEAPRDLVHDFESPAQHLHAHQQAGGDSPTAQELVTSFNRFNQEVVDHVCDNQYNLARTLDELNASFTAATPIAARTVGDFPRSAMALKPVFWVVRQNGVTMFPYWAGDGAEATTNTVNPTPDTWRQCVAVVPPGTDPGALPVTGSCNGVQAVAREVIGLDRFYHFRLSEGDIANASTFGFLDGAPPEVGDYVLLVAMHVTSKETPRWTWQTFWWSPTPDAAPHGDDRPDDVRDEWRNYQMCAAYSMVTPPGSPDGTPVVCFNPYLETGLTGIDGVESNCMTCHQLAAWPNFSTNYQASGIVLPNDAAIFGQSLKLDFLWSLTRAM